MTGLRGTPPAPEDAIREALDFLCQQALETPLASVLAIPESERGADDEAFCVIAAALDSLVAANESLNIALEASQKNFATMQARVIAAEQQQGALVAAKEAAEDKMAALAEALRMVPPDRLELLADWHDQNDARIGRTGDQVQRDLRQMAQLARAALAALSEPGEASS